MNDTEAIRLGNCSIGNMPLKVESDGRRFRIYWVRIIQGNKESLLTLNTKHAVYEIEYAMRKPLTIYIDGNNHILEEGQFIVVPPDAVHQIVNSHPDGIKFILGFDEETGDMSRNWTNLGAATVLNANPAVQQMVDVLEQISELEVNAFLIPAVLTGVLFFFLDAAVMSKPQKSFLSENELRLEQFRSYVAAANGVGITVNDCAKHLHVSERQLSRICLSMTGEPPSELIRRERLSYVHACMQYSSLTLTEIADMCGFQTVYAMSKFFRKYENINPSEYRKRHYGK